MATLKVTLWRLEKSCSSLKRNKQHDRLELLLNEPALACSKDNSDVSSTNQVVKTSSLAFSSELETMKQVNVDLACELQQSEAALHEERLRTDDLAVKLSKLNIRNINKKLKRR